MKKALILFFGLLCINTVFSQSEPKTAKEYLDRGINFVKQEEWLDALTDFSKAIELDPKLARAYFARGVVYNLTAQSNDDRQKALVDFKEALNIDPNINVAADIYVDIAGIYANFNELAWTYGYAKVALAIDPSNANAQHLIDIMNKENSSIAKNFERRLEREKLFESLNYKELRLSELEQNIRYTTKDGKGFGVEAYVGDHDRISPVESFTLFEEQPGEQPWYNNYKISLNANGWHKNHPEKIEPDKKYKIYIDVLKGDSGFYYGFVTKIEGVPSFGEIIAAILESKK